MIQKRYTQLLLLTTITLAGLAIWIDGPYHPSLSAGSWYRDLNIKLGLDLRGGSHLIYRADVAGINEAEQADALAGVRDVIERRVNTFGVSEPNVQTNRVGDEQRIIVELAGVFDIKEAIALIGATPQLDFRREALTAESPQQLNIDAQNSLPGPIFERTELTGKHLQRATVSFDQLTGTPAVNLEFDKEGSELFSTLTRDNIGKRLAIYLDGVPISAPIVQAEINNGRAVISGGFSIEEARQLTQRLNAGALPIPIELIGQLTIGPALGAQAIEDSVIAGTIGFASVIIWMLVFYRLPGIVASVSLTLYVILFLAVVKIIPVTLTLAGIAGFILSIGMAVDANVLIFERFRENLRLGRSISYALQNGFTQAWSSIWASNVSSLMTALILFGFGTSIIRGFALTYSLGIVLSMFTTITIAKVLLTIALQYKSLHTAFWLSARPVFIKK